MAPKLQRIDKNGTKYYVDYTCPKCGGSGNIKCYSHIDGGVCYMCSGSGAKAVTWAERTPEYEAKLLQRRLQRARKKSEALNEEFLLRNGFNLFGEAWLVLSDTFQIKDELKRFGAKYVGQIGWLFDSSAWAYDLHKITINTLLDNGSTLVVKDPNTWLYAFNHDSASIKRYMDVVRIKHTMAINNKKAYVGSIGERITLSLVNEAVFTFDSQFGPVYVYKFSDANGNTLVWKTSCQDIQEGKRYKVTGTVKSHDEYKGEKQTALTRCKYMEVE